MNPVAELLAERIRRFGPITFAEYMREALYHPVHGYYCRPERERFADYYTSVDVHPIFGCLLGRQFEEMWRMMDRPARFELLEAGSGTGRLAAHILGFVRQQFPEFYQSLHYTGVERSPSRCDQLTQRLAPFVEDGKCRASIEIPVRVGPGCVLSNELLDALPVHRVVQRDGKLQELFVGLAAGQFVEITQPLSTCAITEYFAAQQIALLDGQQAEVGLEVCDWISEIARRLERGFVVTIDYGHSASDLYDRHHMLGTMLAYANHRASEDFYVAPGLHDLTAHVNFTALELWGSRNGLEPLGRTSQMAFLLALGKASEFVDLYNVNMTEADRVRARLHLKTLIFPEGMGERFQVLIQQKAVTAADLTGMRRF